jgi:hypothetical protein
LNGPLDVCRDNIVDNMMISWVQSIGYWSRNYWTKQCVSMSPEKNGYHKVKSSLWKNGSQTYSGSKKCTSHFWQRQGKTCVKSPINLWQQERQADQLMD